MADTVEQTRLTSEMLDAMDSGERDDRWLQEHPEVLAPHRGQWVVVHGRRIVAHSAETPDGAQAAPAAKYPGTLLLYVPTEEEARAVHI